MKKSLLLLLAGIALLMGCRATLEPGGAYAPVITNYTPIVVISTNGIAVTNTVPVVTPTQAPDVAFYAVDAAYATAYSAIDGIFQFELENRDALWKISPNIKHTLDSIRPDAWRANVEYHRARDAYKALPTPAGLTAMQNVVAKINQLLAAAAAVIPKTP